MKDVVIIGKVDGNSHALINKYQSEYNIIAIVDNTVDSNSSIRIMDIPVINTPIETISVYAIIDDKDWDITSAKLLASGKKRHIDFECDWYLCCEDKNCIHSDLIDKMSKETNVSAKKYVKWFA